MEFKLYNSLTRKTSEFKPLTENEVRMYSCGPTVYNYAHIGNMRAFLFADLLQRVLRNVACWNVKWVMNITNIDDKTIRDSALGSKEWKPEMGQQTDSPIDNLLKFTKYYENEFIKDIETLGIDAKHFYKMPKATEYINEMQELITKIFDNGLAYVSEGSVYFNVSEWRKRDTYGRLKKIDFDNFRAGVRIDADQYEREQVSDFVLWKAQKEGEPFWNYELNGENLPGRPGWHIECSAMEYVLLGLPFDIHTGGIDLQFPHHEDEIAQSKAGYGIDPTVFWCHNEFLEVEGEKMSKSKGNFFTVRDLVNKGIDPLDIRYSMFAAHYSSTYNFTLDGIKASRKARLRIQEYIYALMSDKTGSKLADVSEFKDKVFGFLAEDLHTPKALAEVFSFVNKNNAEQFDAVTKAELLNFFKQLNSVFMVWNFDPESNKEQSDIPEEILKMAEDRLNAKKSKNYALADELRGKIQIAGYLVKDTKDGFAIEKA